MRAGLIDRLILLQLTIEKISIALGVSGLFVDIYLHGDVIHRFNFGFKDNEASLLTDPKTIYIIGSTTKCFTATAIAQLLNDGKPKFIIDILPDFKSTNPTATQEAAVEDLLTHRLGLSRSNPGGTERMES